MKLAVISDIHGNLLALEAVLADIAGLGVDQTVNLGDILSGPLQPAQTAELLMDRDFITIGGNHERQVLDLLDRGQHLDPLGTDGNAAGQLTSVHLAWIRALPARLEPDGRLRGTLGLGASTGPAAVVRFEELRHEEADRVRAEVAGQVADANAVAARERVRLMRHQTHRIAYLSK